MSCSFRESSCFGSSLRHDSSMTMVVSVAIARVALRFAIECWYVTYSFQGQLSRCCRKLVHERGPVSSVQESYASALGLMTLPMILLCISRRQNATMTSMKIGEASRCWEYYFFYSGWYCCQFGDLPHRKDASQPRSMSQVSQAPRSSSICLKAGPSMVQDRQFPYGFYQLDQDFYSYQKLIKS